MDFPPELTAGKGCGNEVAGGTIFVARSLWPVSAGHAPAKTESYCERDPGDQERSWAIPIMVEEQAPLSLACPCCSPSALVASRAVRPRVGLCCRPRTHRAGVRGKGGGRAARGRGLAGRSRGGRRSNVHRARGRHPARCCTSSEHFGRLGGDLREPLARLV